VMDAVREHAEITDGLIVQLPLPDGIDVNSVISEIPIPKDVDGISSRAGEHARIVHAPVALAVQEILATAGIKVAGKRAVVVGTGRLVGMPTAQMLEAQGADVTRYTLSEGTFEDIAYADILVLGAGDPHFIKPEHIKEGVVLIDAGTSESAGMVMGDAHPSCAQKASLFTPVPGGVGPIAVAMIFRNMLDLVEHTG
jgi:methylenetetrahydrofolate dehydrogenase (NADP+) / methenyltetrahydrofolate cyclohydrolase